MTAPIDPRAFALLGLGQGLLKAGAPSPYPVGLAAGLASGVQGGVQGLMQGFQFNAEMLKAQREARKAAVEDQIYGSLFPTNAPGSATPALAPGLSQESANAIGAPWAARPALAPTPAPAAAPTASPIPGVDRTTMMLALSGNPGFMKLAELSQSATKPTDRQREALALGYQPGTPAYNAYVGSIANQGGIWQVGPDGQLRLAPGYAQGMGATRAAEEAARAGYDLVEVPVPGGGTQQMTRAQAVQMFGGGQQQQALAPAVPAGNLPPSVVLNRPGGMGFKPAPEQQAGATRFSETLSGEMAKTYADLQRADFNAPTTIGKYRQLGNLLSQVNVGKYTGTTTDLKAAAKSLGFDLTAMGIPDDVAPAQAARALSSQIALELRNPAGGAGMPGALSDQDRKFLESMVPSLENDPGAIGKMIDYRLKLAEREQQVAKMARDYRKRHGGRFDDGFYDELAAWSAKHHLFPAKGAPSNGGFRVVGVEAPGR